MHNIFEQIWSNRIAFIGTFFLVFTLSYIILVAVDFLPEPVTTDENTAVIEVITPVSEAEVETEEINVNTQEVTESTVPEASVSVLPLQVRIEKLNKTVNVLNPESRTIADLDEALLSGVVRHPDSAALNQEGNVFILGHSSYLPNVFNENFQAFNGIQDLAWGDVIEIYSDSSVYEYRVEKVYRAKAAEVTVPIAGEGKRLTLATCNSFGTTDDRYIVEAKQIEVRKI